MLIWQLELLEGFHREHVEASSSVDERLGDGDLLMVGVHTRGMVPTVFVVLGWSLESKEIGY